MLERDDAGAIARRFALGEAAELSGPVARGEQGQVWRLSTSRGLWAVKESFEPSAEADALEAADFQDAVRTEGVHVPAVVRSPEGAVLSDVHGISVRVYSWVDLGPPDPTVDPSEVGRIVAAIHRVRFRGQSPVDPWYTDPVGADRWDGLEVELTRAGAPFTGRFADYRHELVALEELLECPTDLQTCHRDLWADNILATPAGHLCVIDWENCGLADPNQELALVLFEFGGSDANRARSLYDGYRGAGGPGRVEQPGHFSMTIAQLGHIGETACQSWLEPTAPGVERARSAGRAEEFLDERRLTRATIDDLLRALAD